jgi:hypothetical protein
MNIVDAVGIAEVLLNFLYILSLTNYKRLMRPCKCFLQVSKLPTLTYNWAINVVINNALILKKSYLSTFVILKLMRRYN